MAEPVVKSYFPSQIASDLEKITPEYGLKVAKAIEHEWFKRDSGTNRYYNNQNTFHRRRLYARGEQSIQKYKDELSINGDLSYLNLDWKPVPIIPKFVDIVVNGMSDRMFDIKAFSQDPYALALFLFITNFTSGLFLLKSDSILDNPLFLLSLLITSF